MRYWPSTAWDKHRCCVGEGGRGGVGWGWLNMVWRTGQLLGVREEEESGAA